MDGDMSSFQFLFLVYVTFIVFSGKLCNTDKYFLKIVLILGSWDRIV